MKWRVLFLLAWVSFTGGCVIVPHESAMKGRVICVDPGHGGTADTDSFRVGPSGEREEWVNLRVGLILRDLLEAEGARVVMTRVEDVPVDLKARADLAREQEADLFLSVHHNATADRSVNFPIVYYHGQASENRASILMGGLLADALRDELFDGGGVVSVCSDRTIFPNSGTSVLRNSYGIPGVIGEASFFSNAEEEQRLKDGEYNRREAEAYLRAIRSFFRKDASAVHAKNPDRELPVFEALQEGERMSDEAVRWRENHLGGEEALSRGDYEEALRLLELSARAFPDSPVARDCHLLRAEALESLGRADDADVARRRAEEYYVVVE